MTRMRRTVIAVTLTALAMLVAMPTTPANASVSCSGASCKGLNPQTAGCGADAVTKGTWQDPHYPITVELRYSAVCHAAWARATLGGGDSTYAFIDTMYIQHWKYLSGPRVWQIDYEYSHRVDANGLYTGMVPTNGNHVSVAIRECLVDGTCEVHIQGPQFNLA